MTNFAFIDNIKDGKAALAARNRYAEYFCRQTRLHGSDNDFNR